MSLIKCPECGATISDKAECCPTCGCPRKEFGSVHDDQKENEKKDLLSEPTEKTVSTNANTEKPTNKDNNHAQVEPKEKAKSENGCIVGLLIGLGCVFFAFLLIVMSRSCGSGYVGGTPVDTDSVAVIDSIFEDTIAAVVVEEKDASKWSYSEDKDELTGKTTYFAQVVSKNYASFDFPYNHTPIYLTLNIRKSPRYGADVYLTIPEGQFLTKYDGTYISVRFDDGGVVRYSCSEPSDNSSTILFVNGAKGFIKKLKGSKECRISAEFYQEGSPTFTFKTKGLQWNH